MTTFPKVIEGSLFQSFFKMVTIVTIQPNNWGYLVNNCYKMDAKWGHFSDKKFQNGDKIRLGSYTKPNHNPVLNY